MTTVLNPVVSREKADALERVQENLQGRLKQLDDRVRALQSEEVRRRRLALWLKVATVSCGLVLATGFVPELGVQILGAAVLAIVGIERVFANHERVMSVLGAKNAYQRIRRQVEDQHEKGIVEVLPFRDSEPDRAAQCLIGLNERLRSMLAKTIDDVESALDKKNYELLGRLRLEEQPEGSV